MGKSVEKMIFENFENKIDNDNLFNGIHSDLMSIITQKKPKKGQIEELLRKQHDEDIESGD